jgi:hypothetical protein
MSRFGLVELSRGQLLTPLHEIMLGERAAETDALRGLAAIVREAETARGRKLRLHLEGPAARWLGETSIGWREALHQRIGALWEIAQEPAARMHVEVL